MKEKQTRGKRINARITQERFYKLEKFAAAMGVNKSDALNLLIDSANWFEPQNTVGRFSKTVGTPVFVPAQQGVSSAGDGEQG